jgi:predicted phosphodiesterase
MKIGIISDSHDHLENIRKSADLFKQRKIEFVLHLGDFYEFQQDGLKIACYHGTELEINNALVNCGKYDLVIYGHTHEYKDQIEGKTRILNPGTAHGFGDKTTIMVFDTLSGKAELINI